MNKCILLLLAGLFLSLTFDGTPCRNVHPVSYRYYDLKGKVKEIHEYAYDVFSSEVSVEDILSQKPIAQSVVYIRPEGNLEKIYQLTGSKKLLSVQMFRFEGECFLKEEMYNPKEKLIYGVTLKETSIEKEYRLIYSNPQGVEYKYYDVKLNDSYQICELVQSDTAGNILSTVQKTYDKNGRLTLEKEWLGENYSEMKVEYLKYDARGNWIDRFHTTNNSRRKILLHRKILYYK